MTGFYKMLKIPEERIAVLIGSNGSIKRDVEAKCNVRMQIDGKTGEVKVEPLSSSGFDEGALTAIEIVKAISHGFPPSTAFRLFNEDVTLLIIDLRINSDMSRSNENRLKGRIIGARGKSRKTIEELTGVSISIHGHTVSFIGTFEETNIAHDAVMMLLKGRSHKVVYQMLQNARSKAKLEKLKLWIN